MNRLVFAVILLSGWIIFIAINQGLFFDKLSAMPGDTINNSSNSHAPTIRQDLGIEDNELQDSNLQNQIQSELYNSISSGMSYEEVSSIIGWQGVLIDENEVENGGKIVKTKVYQWNYEDVYSTDTTSVNSERAGTINPYWNLTLEFQNDLLIDKTFSDLNP
jgi:hypothetical protein